MDRSETREPNHLAGETSPYLLQHLYNPVDWHPWGPDALERARAEDKPIFLSIGYAACHWCHVMEHESFEDDRVAQLLNRNFVPIKVDREERPDLDEIYMNAVQLLTGQGGWPLNVFLTPELEPFFGGTYFPPEGRYGRPGFSEILRQVRQAWAERRSAVVGSASELTSHLRQIAAGQPGDAGVSAVGRAHVARASAELAARFDDQRGGFGPAPKFPPDGALALLLNEHVRTGEGVPLRMVATTLDAMASGGLYDHVGGGFARYSVDERWLVPHFEKMLYNQALLVPVYTDAWLLTGKPAYRRVVAETLDFVRREMTDADGGFWSSLDADSEGVEGKFYVWTPSQVVEVLGSEAGRLYAGIYDITTSGNFEGHSIPNLLHATMAERATERGVEEQVLAEELEPLRQRMLAARERRVRPATDDKILTAWNGLMISAFARSYQVFSRAGDLAAARRAAAFVSERLLQDGRLLATYRAGRAKLNAYLDDYAFLGRGLLDLYESGFDPAHLSTAEKLARTMIERFEDRDSGGFFFTSDDHETLLTRNRSVHDGALPSGCGVGLELLLRLASHLDDAELRRPVERTLVAYRAAVERMPAAHTAVLLAATWADPPPAQIGIVGDPADARTRELLAAVHSRYRRRPVIQVARSTAEAGMLRLLRGRQSDGAGPMAFVCRDYACQRPTREPEELARQLERL